MGTKRWKLSFAGVVLITAVMLLAGSQSAFSSDSRFLVSAPHTKEECVKTLDEANAMGSKFLGKCEWGCMAGDHTAYLMIDAKDEAALKAMLPASWTKAKIVKLNTFTPEQIKSFHKK